MWSQECAISNIESKLFVQKDLGNFYGSHARSSRLQQARDILPIEKNVVKTTQEFHTFSVNSGINFKNGFLDMETRKLFSLNDIRPASFDPFNQRSVCQVTPVD